MRKIVLMLMAAFFMGGVTMAQQARRSDKMPEPKVRAERMTERMAKEYSLMMHKRVNYWKPTWHWWRKWVIDPCIAEQI